MRKGQKRLRPRPAKDGPPSSKREDPGPDFGSDNTELHKSCDGEEGEHRESPSICRRPMDWNAAPESFREFFAGLGKRFLRNLKSETLTFFYRMAVAAKASKAATREALPWL